MSATYCKKIQMLTAEIDPKAGSFAKIYAALKEARVNILTTWGYHMSPETARAHFYASDPAKAKEVLLKVVKSITEHHAVYAEGEDRIGSYELLLEKIAKANINLTSTTAFAVGNKFATVFFAEEKDIPALCKALGC